MVFARNSQWSDLAAAKTAANTRNNQWICRQRSLQQKGTFPFRLYEEVFKLLQIFKFQDDLALYTSPKNLQNCTFRICFVRPPSLLRMGLGGRLSSNPC